MDAEQIILTRQLPKTGALPVSPPVDYDDGYYQAGWWKGRLNVNNKTRFIAKTIGGNDVVIDRATGLMWAADAAEKGCAYNATLTWVLGIQYANDLDFAGFTDWRMPNINELVSIINYNTYNPTAYTDFFLNTTLDIYWSSTPVASILTFRWGVRFDTGFSNRTNSTFTCYLRCVRGGV